MDEIFLRDFEAAVALGGSGDRQAARRALLAMWESVAGPDSLRRCVLAHALAELHDAPGDQIEWDLRALRAADEVTDATEGEGVPISVRGLYPSVHVALAGAYVRLGDAKAAHGHTMLARVFLGALPDDGYRTTLGDALAAVESALRQ